MSDALADNPRRTTLGRRIVILGWAMLLALATCLAGAAVITVRGTFGVFILGFWPLASLVATVAVFVTYALLVRLAEGRWPSELTLKGAGRELGQGLALAILAFGLLMGLLTLSGAIVWRPLASADWRWALTNGLTQGAFGGLLLGLVAQGAIARLGSLALLPVAGVVLAALTAAWLVAPEWVLPPIQRVNAALGGAVLGLLWLRRRTLWLGLGLSMGWGALSGAVIGSYALDDSTEASIYEPGRGVLIAWLKGTEGPEASIMLLAGCVLAVAFLTWRAWKEGCFSRA
ncbi:hypothetical protein [Caulobacter endophyticus]|uniref:hypothetical protein n=1 Tax=Caulobacter endophyticus TaxID=2172652 RepID=UPI00240F17A0|nr:hypothetical protein [Caulobacter endophyticus]MDG2530218.1 hypothetical protein [Caulobacter endophyticus]